MQTVGRQCGNGVRLSCAFCACVARTNGLRCGGHPISGHPVPAPRALDAFSGAGKREAGSTASAAGLGVTKTGADCSFPEPLGSAASAFRGRPAFVGPARFPAVLLNRREIDRTYERADSVGVAGAVPGRLRCVIRPWTPGKPASGQADPASCCGAARLAVVSGRTAAVRSAGVSRGLPSRCHSTQV